MRFTCYYSLVEPMKQTFPKKFIDLIISEAWNKEKRYNRDIIQTYINGEN